MSLISKNSILKINKYDNIVLANCETMILNTNTNVQSNNPFLINMVNINVLIKLHSLLSDNGHLYLNPFKPLYEYEKKFISTNDIEKDLFDSLASYFTYIGRKEFTFGVSSPRARYVFRKI